MTAAIDTSPSPWLNRRAYPYEPHHLLVEGGRMHYIDEGQGEPVLFVHGNSTWSYLWRVAIRELTRDGYRCVAPDLIGFGLSEKPSTFSHSPIAHCRNLTRLVEELDLRDITLVVHDMGGPIGLSMAMDHPDRIKRIVMLNTWFWDLGREQNAPKSTKLASSPLGHFAYVHINAGPKSIKSRFVDRAKFAEEFQNAMLGPFEQKESRQGPLALAKQVVEAGPWFHEIWMQRKDLAAKPMMLLWGCKDATLGQKTLDRIWHEFPLAEVHDFEDGGHYLIEERPREVVGYLRQFVKTPVQTGGYVA